MQLLKREQRRTGVNVQASEQENPAENMLILRAYLQPPNNGTRKHECGDIECCLCSRGGGVHSVFVDLDSWFIGPVDGYGNGLE